MWHSQGASQEGVDGAWSFRPFFLLSTAITSGWSLLGEWVRSGFPNSKIIPVLPSLPSLWLAGFFLSFLLPPFCFPFPFLSLSLLLFWEGEGSTCHSPPCDKLLFHVAGIQHLQHIPLKASCQHYQFESFLPLLPPGSTSTFLIRGPSVGAGHALGVNNYKD